MQEAKGGGGGCNWVQGDARVGCGCSEGGGLGDVAHWLGRGPPKAGLAASLK